MPAARYSWWGMSTSTSVSPSTRDWAATSAAAFVTRRSWALDDVEGEAGEPERAPTLGQAGRARVEVEVHGPELIGGERAGVLDGAGRGHVEAVDEDDHDVAAEDRRLGGEVGIVLELGLLLDVLAVQAEQQPDHERDHGEDDPRALGELGDAGDERGAATPRRPRR